MQIHIGARHQNFQIIQPEIHKEKMNKLWLQLIRGHFFLIFSPSQGLCGRFSKTINSSYTNISHQICNKSQNFEINLGEIFFKFSFELTDCARPREERILTERCHILSILFQFVKLYQEVPASQVYSRCANTHNCLESTLGRQLNTEVRFNKHNLASTYLIIYLTIAIYSRP